MSSTGRTYVTLLDMNEVVQTTTNPVSALGHPIGVGSVPPHVVFSPDGTRAFVTNQYSDDLSVIDVASSRTVATVPLQGSSFNLIVTADGKKLFVSVASGRVYAIDLASGTIIDSIQFGAAVNGFARHPTREFIYVSSRDGATVAELNTDTSKVVRTFKVGQMPQRIAVSPDGEELLVATETTGLEIWSLESGRQLARIAMDAYGLELSPDGKKAYVTGPLSGTITVVDRATRQVDTVLQVGGKPRNVAFSPDGTTALVTSENDLLIVIH